MNTHSFDEELYLSKNPDVKAAVERGECESGLAHYLSYGQAENRPGAPYPGDEEQAGPTVPPRHLRFRVHGADDVKSFASVGEALARGLLEIADGRMALTPNNRILDFGCGCGRVISSLSKLTGAQIFGTDIDAEAIEWCNKSLSSVGKFSVNDKLPPLPFDDNTFDLVYSISIFTHLPEYMQFAWLGEINRVLKPSGYAILTTHGSSLFPSHLLSAEITSEFNEKGFYYHVGAGTDGLPDFYQTTFHSEAYILRNWTALVDVKTVLQRSAGDHQDSIICQKRM
jgi:SAM-dependent methyltransferase